MGQHVLAGEAQGPGVASISVLFMLRRLDDPVEVTNSETKILLIGVLREIAMTRSSARRVLRRVSHPGICEEPVVTHRRSGERLLDKPSRLRAPPPPRDGRHPSAIRRQLPPGNEPDDLVFTGLGGGPGQRGGPSVPQGTRTALSRHNLHRTLPGRRSQTGRPGRPPSTNGTARAARPTRRRPPTPGAAHRSAEHAGSTKQRHMRYRHTTPEMAMRVVDSIDRRLTIVLGVAEQLLDRRSSLPVGG